MQVLAHISLNFQQPNFVTVYAAQNDKLSRFINAALLDGATPWTPPTGALMTVKYRRGDGGGGFYDTLEDGSPAYNVEADGTVTLGLAEQLLAVAGVAAVELRFYNAAGEVLSTACFRVMVQPSAWADDEIVESEPYINVLSQQIAAVLDAATAYTGLTAEAETLAAGSEATASVSGGSGGEPFHILLGIPRGAVGPSPTVTSSAQTWQESSSGEQPPTGTWSSSPPASPVPGGYLWSKTVLTFSNGSTATSYTVTRNGVDGSGAPGTQAPLPDSGAGAVGTSTSFAREDHAHPAPAVTFSVSLTAAGWAGGAQTISDARFLASGYAYIVAPSGADMAAYGAAGIYADAVTVNGSMTFHAARTPSAALAVIVQRTVSA
ncbi:MAG: hypothetical protein IJI06_09865 [Oscillospiraceae bacterium]|nr:hypothetical protein [Oscillospiraceae bacterium]